MSELEQLGDSLQMKRFLLEQHGLAPDATQVSRFEQALQQVMKRECMKPIPALF